ncbi:unnamed protein product [Brugia timori]|uniref:Pentatricopeptide repeat-containing protein n=1 Tax=Brugia timori TaxID=42155 RepID=A0A0R3Q661_9BILA|nr:unnamed protein product [Brugia timori]
MEGVNGTFMNSVRSELPWHQLTSDEKILNKLWITSAKWTETGVHLERLQQDLKKSKFQEKGGVQDVKVRTEMSRWRSVTMMDWMRGREREVDRSLSYWALSRVKVHSCLDLDLLLGNPSLIYCEPCSDQLYSLIFVVTFNAIANLAEFHSYNFSSSTSIFLLSTERQSMLRRAASAYSRVLPNGKKLLFNKLLFNKLRIAQCRRYFAVPQSLIQQNRLFYYFDVVGQLHTSQLCYADIIEVEGPAFAESISEGDIRWLKR